MVASMPCGHGMIKGTNFVRLLNPQSSNAHPQPLNWLFTCAVFILVPS